jgi:GNAT superfamily N-acetyltransferase
MGVSTTVSVPAATTSIDRQSETERVTLRDGSAVTIRPVSTEDESALRSFLDGLCLETRRLRFFTGGADIESAAHMAVLNDISHYGLIAHDELGVLVGHASYIQLDDERAEVAVEVADHLHGRGLGTMLVERLAVVAEQHEITYFVAEVLSENKAILDVFREGFDARVLRHEGPEERVEFLTAGWRLARERFKESIQ